MGRKTVAILLASTPNYAEFAFKYFILTLNKVQNFYEFFFVETDDETLGNFYSQDYYESDNLFNSFSKTVRPKIEEAIDDTPEYWISIITSRIGENLFFETQGKVSFITTDTWEKYYSPPSLFEYLSHCIISSLLFMNDDLDLESHNWETRGCCLDYTYEKMNDRVDISLGYICDECKKKIISNTSSKYFLEVKGIVSRGWIGDIDVFGSVAYNLKHFFKLDLTRDSGFNKSYWDKAKGQFYELPKSVIELGVGSMIGILLTLLIIGG